MTAKRIRRIRIGAVVVVLLGLTAALYVYRHPAMRRRRVEAAIQAYIRAPNVEKAQRLVAAMDDGHADPEQGSRILALLAKPRVVVRRAYAGGRPVGFKLIPPDVVVLLQRGPAARPWPLEFKSDKPVVWTDDPDPRGAGLSRPPGVSGLFLWGDGGDPPHEAGTHRVEVTYKVGYRSTIEELDIHWPSSGPFPGSLLPDVAKAPAEKQVDYEYQVMLPVELRVVPPEQAEQIELVSGAAADRAMRSAIRWRPCPAVLSARDASNWIEGQVVTLICSDLPWWWAARIWYRDPEGRETLLLCPLVWVPRGVWTSIDIPVSMGLRERPGTEGALVLKPEHPDLMYHDPTVKAVWGGTLEIPLRFSASQPARRGRAPSQSSPPLRSARPSSRRTGS